MADSGGHWDTLAEAQKLTQSVQVAGVFEEDLKFGALQTMLPLWQLKGLELEYLREKEGQTANKATAGSTLTWQDAVKYDKITRDLVRGYIQTPLDKFNAEVYGGLNSYEAIQLVENKKALMRLIADELIYGDATYATGLPEVDGLHALAYTYPTALNGASNGLDIDNGEAGLSIFNLRKLKREMKYGIDFFLAPQIIIDRISASLQEAGIASYAGPGRFNFTKDQFGEEVLKFDGIPFVRCDFLVAEEANTGTPSSGDARAKHSTGDEQYSIFAIKRGQPALKQPGLGYVWGGEGMGTGDMMRIERFEKLENMDASGLRLVSYYGLADGSRMALGRIYDIEDAAVTA